MRGTWRKDAPYISCSSMASTSSSSAASISLSDDDAKEGDGDEVLKGSLRYVDEGMVLAKSPKLVLLEVCEEGRRRRVGRSEALRMVGLALSGSAMVQNGG